MGLGGPAGRGAVHGAMFLSLGVAPPWKLCLLLLLSQHSDWLLLRPGALPRNQGTLCVRMEGEVSKRDTEGGKVG